MSRFACAATCMDGRIMDAVTSYLRRVYRVDYVDLVTEPGINKILAENADHAVVSNIKKKIGVSVKHHHSGVLAIVGHPDCSGNPAGRKEQEKHLQTAEKVVETFDFQVEIVLLWVNDDWKTVEVVPAV